MIQILFILLINLNYVCMNTIDHNNKNSEKQNKTINKLIIEENIGEILYTWKNKFLLNNLEIFWKIVSNKRTQGLYEFS